MEWRYELWTENHNITTLLNCNTLEKMSPLSSSSRAVSLPTVEEYKTNDQRLAYVITSFPDLFWSTVHLFWGFPRMKKGHSEAELLIFSSKEKYYELNLLLGMHLSIIMPCSVIPAVKFLKANQQIMSQSQLEMTEDMTARDPEPMVT